MRKRNHRDILALLLAIASTATGLRKATIYKSVTTITRLLGTIWEILTTAPLAALDAAIDTLITTTWDIIAKRHTTATDTFRSSGEAMPGPAPFLQAVRIDGIASAEYHHDVLANLERENDEWNNMIHLQDSPQTSTSITTIAPQQTIDQVPYSAVAFSLAQEEPSAIAVTVAPVRATTRKKRPSRATGEITGTPVRPVAGPSLQESGAQADNPGNAPDTVLYRKKGNKYTIVKRRVKGECLYTLNNGAYIPQ